MTKKQQLTFKRSNKKKDWLSQVDDILKIDS